MYLFHFLSVPPHSRTDKADRHAARVDIAEATMRRRCVRATRAEVELDQRDIRALALRRRSIAWALRPPGLMEKHALALDVATSNVWPLGPAARAARGA